MAAMKLPLLLLLGLGTAFQILHAADIYPSLALASSAPDFNLPGVDGRNSALKDFATLDA